MTITSAKRLRRMGFHFDCDTFIRYQPNLMQSLHGRGSVQWISLRIEISSRQIRENLTGPTYGKWNRFRVSAFI